MMPWADRTITYLNVNAIIVRGFDDVAVAIALLEFVERPDSADDFNIAC